MRSLRVVISISLALSGSTLLLGNASAVSGVDVDGSYLKHDVTGSLPAIMGIIALDSVEDFPPGPGVAIFDPGTPEEEVFAYAHANSATGELVGVARPSPVPHQAGTFVAPSSSTAQPDIDSTDESEVDYLLDLAGTTASGIPLVAGGAAGYGGYFCKAYSHNPHDSDHNKGMVAAKGETVCPGEIVEWVDMGVRSSLYRFVQQEGGYVKVAGPEESTSEYPKKGDWHVSVRLLAGCPTQETLFQLRSHHWVYFNNGTYDDGDTINTQPVKCDKNLP